MGGCVGRASPPDAQPYGDDPMFDGHEAAIHSEMGETRPRSADLFERLADLPDPNVQLRRVRNLLRLGRPAEASALIDPWLAMPDRHSCSGPMHRSPGG